MWWGKALFSLASRPACQFSPPLLLMLSIESCVCCHTALRHCPYECSWAGQSSLTVVSVLLDSCVLSWVDCLLLGSFPWICSQWTVGSPWYPQTVVWVSCGSSLFQHWSSFLLPSRESPCVLSLTLGSWLPSVCWGLEGSPCSLPSPLNFRLVHLMSSLSKVELTCLR